MNKTIVTVISPNVNFGELYIDTNYTYSNTIVEKVGAEIVAYPISTDLKIRTERLVPKVGVMLVGWGGNNGSTFTAAVLANQQKLTWNTKKGTLDSNWFGSVTQASTVKLGIDGEGNDVFVPMSQLLPMVNPDDIEIGGWDISDMNLSESMSRAQVLDLDLQKQVKKQMARMQPLPSIYNADFIAANQSERATNVIGGSKYQQYLQVRSDIANFKKEKQVDKVIVLWTANTERFCSVLAGIHDSAAGLEKALKDDEAELSPSTIFAMASIAEKCPYINGSPQNTFVPGVIELAHQQGVFVGGDDFKSGQTKLKSVLVDFLVSAGIKPTSIVSYNHLGNNDGKNLSAAKQFRSKEITKSNVVDDMVASNSLLYAEGEKPDHVVVIKYVPYVGDSKRAMDEYSSEILLHGSNTIAVHNTCEDSLLAAPIMLDLLLLTELFTRVTFKPADGEGPYCNFHPVLSVLSYLLKAPLVPAGTPVINALFKQRVAIENIMRACLGLAPDNNMMLEHKIPFMMSQHAGSLKRKAELHTDCAKKSVNVQNGQ